MEHMLAIAAETKVSSLIRLIINHDNKDNMIALHITHLMNRRNIKSHCAIK